MEMVANRPTPTPAHDLDDTSYRRADTHVRPWQRPDRGNHELHEHEQPERHARAPDCLRRKRSSAGCTSMPSVKTSLGPGSRVVSII